MVNNYDWTSAPKNSTFRKNAPRIWMRSYKLKTNNLVQTIKNYQNIVTAENAKSFYEKMYGDVAEADETFRFPYFNDAVRAFSNTFGDTFQDGVGGGNGIGTALNDWTKAMVGNIAQVGGIIGTEAMGAAASQIYNKDFAGAIKTVSGGVKGGGNPGSYVETPMFYQFEKNDGPVEVTFALSNTINEGAIKQNKDLITKLTKINRPLRHNSISVDPPRIYKITIPGHRFIQWAWCTQFNVQFLGTKRMIDGDIVPEGYLISMVFQSLTLEHGGFMDQINTED